MSKSGSNPRVRLQKPGAKFNAFVSVILSITLVTNVSFMQVTSAYAETGTTNQTQPNKASADTEKTPSSAVDALSMLDAAEADLNADNTSSASTDAAKPLASAAETMNHAESDMAAEDANTPKAADASDTASESADAPKEDLGEMNMKRSLSTTPESADITPTANDKITISNVALSDHEIFESRDGSLPISVSFDWEGKGLVQGDTLVIPMSDAFDSITKNVVFTFGTADVLEVGTLTLDYNARKIITKFTADMDPHKIYHGRVKIGTFVSRDYFTEIDSTKTIDIPSNTGSNQAQLRVVYDYLNQPDPRYGASFGRVYVRAIEETMSADQHESDVLWSGIINQRNNQMINPEVYASSSIISDISVSNWTGEREVKLFYNDTAYPSYTMDESTFKVYEADVSDSMGYTRGKELVYGKDFTFERSLPDGSDGYTLKFIGDYANTDKSIVFEGVAHYTDLQIDDGSDDRGASATEIAGSAAIVYDTTSGAVIGDTNGALIVVNNSSVTNITSDEPPAPDKGSVTVIHVAKDTGNCSKTRSMSKKTSPWERRIRLLRRSSRAIPLQVWDQKLLIQRVQ